VARSSGRAAVTATLTFILLLALAAIPAVVYLGSSSTDAPTTTPAARERQTAPVEPDIPEPDYSTFVENSTGSQVSFYRLSDGHRTGTATERFARPALSLIKLYIAEYVLEHGSVAEQYQAIEMISSSDDRSAGRLFQKYPDSISTVARDYGLGSTRSAQQWGFSVTSTYDAVSFIAQLIEQDPTHPILVAMAEADPVAADGYGQDFGTSVLPGVIGTKWGWSDDRDLHSSVSFGENFVVAAAVTGTADDLTGLVEFQLTDEVEDAAEKQSD